MIMLRLKSKQIELSSTKMIPLLDNIILIDTEQIEMLNKEINRLSKNKISILRKSLEEKQKIEAELIEMDILQKEIEESLTESLVLTRLKVSK